MTAIINKNGYEFLECIPLNEHELIHYTLLAGSNAVVKFDGKYLLCFNTWRKQWEIPAGGRNDSETAKECATILFWNLIDDVGYIDVVDQAVLKWCNKKKPDRY